MFLAFAREAAKVFRVCTRAFILARILEARDFSVTRDTRPAVMANANGFRFHG